MKLPLPDPVLVPRVDCCVCVECGYDVRAKYREYMYICIKTGTNIEYKALCMGIQRENCPLELSHCL